jgi:hypothetical protein
LAMASSHRRIPLRVFSIARFSLASSVSIYIPFWLRLS